MICPSCNQERGCGCGFKPHPYKDNLSVCSTCYVLALEELKVKKSLDNAQKPEESTN